LDLELIKIIERLKVDLSKTAKTLSIKELAPLVNLTPDQLNSVIYNRTKRTDSVRNAIYGQFPEYFTSVSPGEYQPYLPLADSKPSVVAEPSYAIGAAVDKLIRVHDMNLKAVELRIKHLELEIKRIKKNQDKVSEN